MSYLDELRKRKKKTRAYTEHQLVGLEIAGILNDEKHKSLYMKLAKEYKPETLLRIAKDVASRKNVENKGAYFMRLFHLMHPDDKNSHNRQQER